MNWKSLTHKAGSWIVGASLVTGCSQAQKQPVARHMPHHQQDESAYVQQQQQQQNQWVPANPQNAMVPVSYAMAVDQANQDEQGGCAACQGVKPIPVVASSNQSVVPVGYQQGQGGYQPSYQQGNCPCQGGTVRATVAQPGTGCTTCQNVKPATDWAPTANVHCPACAARAAAIQQQGAMQVEGMVQPVAGQPVIVQHAGEPGKAYQMVTPQGQQPQLAAGQPGQVVQSSWGAAQAGQSQPVATSEPPIMMTGEPGVKFPRGEATPARRAYTDITAPRSMGHAPDYTWLVGQVEQTSKGWRLRYASLEDEDRYGGSVILGSDRQLEKLQNGNLVRVRGAMLEPEMKHEAPRYRVEAVEPIQ